MSTKTCPRCQSSALALFTSLNMKYCTECCLSFPWNLDPGQRALFNNVVGSAEQADYEKFMKITYKDEHE